MMQAKQRDCDAKNPGDAKYDLERSNCRVLVGTGHLRCGGCLNQPVCDWSVGIDVESMRRLRGWAGKRGTTSNKKGFNCNDEKYQQCPSP